eukprot:Hpha_TRINITY_DN9240_c0_g1::TRINITY_DN9240_c0_g1_i1::g.28630::m.28630
MEQRLSQRNSVGRTVRRPRACTPPAGRGSSRSSLVPPSAPSAARFSLGHTPRRISKPLELHQQPSVHDSRSSFYKFQKGDCVCTDSHLADPTILKGTLGEVLAVGQRTALVRFAGQPVPRSVRANLLSPFRGRVPRRRATSKRVAAYQRCAPVPWTTPPTRPQFPGAVLSPGATRRRMGSVPAGLRGRHRGSPGNRKRSISASPQRASPVRLRSFTRPRNASLSQPATRAASSASPAHRPTCKWSGAVAASAAADPRRMGFHCGIASAQAIAAAAAKEVHERAEGVYIPFPGDVSEAIEHAWRSGVHEIEVGDTIVDLKRRVALRRLTEATTDGVLPWHQIVGGSTVGRGCRQERARLFVSLAPLAALPQPGRPCARFAREGAV